MFDSVSPKQQQVHIAQKKKRSLTRGRPRVTPPGAGVDAVEVC